MPLNLSSLLSLANLLKGLSGIIDVQALIALVKAAVPLPKTDADVPAWLDRIGIKEPAAPVVGPILQKLIPDVVPPPPVQLDGAAALPTLPTFQSALAPIAADFASATDDELAEACGGLEAQGVPVWLIPLVIEAAKLLAEWWKNRA